MRIAIDISQIVYKTGVSRYTQELVKHLLLIDKQDDYLLFGSSLRQNSQLKSFVKSIASENMSASIFPIPTTILELLFNRFQAGDIQNIIGKVDVFHSSDWTQPKTKAKSVTTIHDLAVLKFPNLFHPKIVDVQKRRLDLVKKECRLVIAVSQSTKNDIVQFLDIPQSKIRVIYEAASDQFKPKSKGNVAMIKQKYKLPDNYLLTVASFGARKNLKNLSEAFSQISRKFDSQLVVIGQTDNLVMPNFYVLGFVPDDDLASLYSGAKAFVYPSVYEGFGLPIIEAMSCSIPVICSNTSSLPEIGGEAAIYFDPENIKSISEAIAKVLSMSDDQYQNLKEKSFIQSSKFSWQKCAEETLSAYKELGGRT